MANVCARQLGNLRLVWVALIVALFALTMSATSEAASPAAKADVIPGQYIVVFEDSVERTEAIAEAQTERLDGDLGSVYDIVLNGYSAELSKEAVAALRNNPKVKYVAPDHEVGIAAQTTPFGLDRIYDTANPAADIDETDDVRVNADVAVIDTGVENTHPDLNVVARTDCTSVELGCIDNTGADKLGHGTHVGGTVGALDNASGVVGVAPGARLWSVKVIADNGVGSESTIINGIKWVTARAGEIEVANMSLGAPDSSPAMIEAIADSVNAGVVYTVAAMNSNEDAGNWTPAKSPDVIAVSALSDYDGLPGTLYPGSDPCDSKNNLGKDDFLASFSNWGTVIDIAAPGSCINSTWPGGTYREVSGTSMAAPHVAGAAAILASESNPNSRKDVEAIRQKLLSEGSLNWNEDSADGVKEPLLDVRPPTSEAATFPASDPHTYTAKLNGVVSAGGVSSSYRFEYGTTTSYGSVAPASPKSIGSGVGDQEVGETIAVNPETTYHFRISLTNSKGTFYGEDQTFKTTYWNAQEISNPPEEDGKASEMSGVSCTAWDFCMAVGDYSKKNGPTSYGFRATAQRWDGQKWSVLAVPSPAGFGNSDSTGLESVSCTSPSACTAVGWGNKSGRVPFVVRWNGTEWSMQSTPVPAGLKGNYELSGVGCTSSTSCTAVGKYLTEPEAGGFPKPGKEEVKTLIETWNGSEWQIQASPNPEGKKINALTGISCSSASACTAVGSARASSKETAEQATLIERWNGSTWAIQASPNAPGTTENKLEEVSCSSAAVCTAVGNTNKIGGGSLQNDPVGFALGWTGGEWTVSTSQLPAPLYSVSCLADARCHAVGPTIGRAWDGSSWSAEDPAVIPGSTQFKAEALSCLAKMPCTAVGRYFGPRTNPGFQPMAQHLAARQGTPASSAARLNSEVSPTTISSTNPYGNHFWQFNTSQQGCEAPQLSGSFINEAKKLGATAADTSCYMLGTGNQLRMNGCELLYRFGAKTETGTFKGTVDIYCPEGKPITFTGGAPANACQVAVPAQYGLPATFENVGVGKERAVKVTVDEKSLEHSQLSGQCTLGSFSNGLWSGSWKIEGSSGGSPVGIWLTGEGFELPPSGIAIVGTSSPFLAAGTYPISIAGSQSEGAQHALSFASGLFKCTTAKLSSSVSGGTSQFTVTPEYAGCTTAGLPSTVNTNGCTYTFNVLNQPPSGSTYAGHADIACPAGKAIEIVAKGSEKVKCTITIGTQTTDAGGLSFTNESPTSTIGLGLSVAGIDYQQVKGEGLGACTSGSFTTGTYTGGSTLVGSY